MTNEEMAYIFPARQKPEMDRLRTRVAQLEAERLKLRGRLRRAGIARKRWRKKAEELQAALKEATKPKVRYPEEDYDDPWEY